MREIVLATSNKGKILDYQEIIQAFPFQFIPQSQFGVGSVPETGKTFLENALIKIHHAQQYTTLPCLAEDSGLIVDALDGAPGLYSARYAGENASDEDNIQKLLADLKKHPKASRRARFYVITVLSKYPHDPAPLFAEGSFEGEILEAPRGTEGFGYLPIFYLPHLGCSAAELSLKEKNKINHRSQAAHKILKQYQHFLASESAG